MERNFRCLLILAILLGCWSVANAHDFDVATYGAVPDDSNDDTAAINQALNNARLNGSAARIVFHPGVYNLNNRLNIVSPCNNLLFEGNGATLIWSIKTIGFYMTDCANVTLQNFFIDYDPLPFTGGRVTAVDTVGKSFDLEIAAPHTATARPMQGYITYDVARDRFGMNNAPNNEIKNIDVYQTAATKLSEVLQTEPVPVLRVFTEGAVSESILGRNLVVRHQIYSYNCIQATRTHDLAVLNTTVWTCPGMGIAVTHSTNVVLDRFEVRKKAGRWMSSAADGSHFNNVRGTISITNGYYEGMGDDAINVHNSVMVVWANNGTHLALSKGRDQPGKPDLLEVGDVIGLASADDPFHPYIHATITSVSSPAENFTYCSFDVDVSQVAVDDVGILETIATAYIANVTVTRNRARGFLINNRQTLVEDCTFDQISGPALLMDCEAFFWWEGNCARNLHVRKSRFIDCNYGAAQRAGLVMFYSGRNATTVQGAGVFQNITFESNSFEGPVARSFFHIGSASDVTIVNNHFDNTELSVLEAVAVICSSSDVTLACNELTEELLANTTAYFQGYKNNTSCQSPSWNIDVEAAFDPTVCIPPVAPSAPVPVDEVPNSQTIPAGVSEAVSLNLASAALGLVLVVLALRE